MKNKLNTLIILSLIIILNYTLYCLLIVDRSIIILGLSLYLYIFFKYTLFEIKNYVLVIFYLLLIFVTVFTATYTWDARSIWMFHAKRIFLDGSAYAQMDGYAFWSQNDYPVLYPALASSIAVVMGYWNEVIPKTASVIILAPPLIVMSMIFNSRNYIISILIILAVCKQYLVNGYADAILSLYFVSIIILILWYRNDDTKISNKLEYHYYILLTLFSIITVLLKNEGLVLVLITLALNTLNENKKGVYITILGITLSVYFFSWKYQLLINNIGTDIIIGGAIERVFERLIRFDSITFIFKKFLFNLYFLLPVIFILTKKYKHYNYILKIIISYIILLVFIYASTPKDLYWHIDNSIERTLMPINLLSLIYIVYFYFKLKK